MGKAETLLDAWINKPMISDHGARKVPSDGRGPPLLGRNRVA
jgi:hypothetical protein